MLLTRGRNVSHEVQKHSMLSLQWDSQKLSAPAVSLISAIYYCDYCAYDNNHIFELKCYVFQTVSKFVSTVFSIGAKHILRPLFRNASTTTFLTLNLSHLKLVSTI